MKKVIILFLFLLSSGVSFGQFNPVKNLTWSHGYDYPYNIYNLDWTAPDPSSSDSLKGYNVYRDGLLWRFQTGIGLSCNPLVICNDPGFLLANPFWIKVTAVYGPEGLESVATDSIQDVGILIGVPEKTKSSVRISPNPVKTGDVIKIMVSGPWSGGSVTLYNSLGVPVRVVKLREGTAVTEINSMGLPPGCYYILAGNENSRNGQRLIIR